MTLTPTYAINYAKHKVFKPLAEANPDLFVWVQKFRYRSSGFRHKLVDKDTDITIEGFPRSANSFSVRAFEWAQQGEKYKVANHSHSWSQVLRSVRFSIPTIVLIRDPGEAIISLGAMRLQNMQGNYTRFEGSVNVAWSIEYYIKFYSQLLPVINDVVVAPFHDVIHDFGSIIDEVNRKYGSSFRTFDHTLENQDFIFSNNRRHLSPSEEREGYKDFIVELLGKGECPELMDRASGVYEQWMMQIGGERS